MEDGLSVLDLMTGAIKEVHRVEKAYIRIFLVIVRPATGKGYRVQNVNISISVANISVLVENYAKVQEGLAIAIHKEGVTLSLD